MPERPDNPGKPRDPSLDDLIDRGDADALARAARQSEALRRHVEAQGKIDESLRRVFVEPDVAISLPGAAAGHGRPRWMKWIPYAAAALVLIAAVIGWRVWTVQNRPDILGPLYHRIVDAGFKPDSVCTTDEDFSAWTRQYLRQSLTPTSRPEGLEYVGWSTARVLGPISAILLAKVDGKPVIVVMERTDRQIAYPGKLTDPALHVYSKKIKGIVMYEVTPISKETILPVVTAGP